MPIIMWKMLNHIYFDFATSVMAGVIAWWQMECPLQGDLSCGRCYCHGSWCYLSFSSEVLSRTSSQMWGRWYLPIFLFRDGLLTLMLHFLQTWGSSQQWAKACLFPKIDNLVIEKLFDTSKDFVWHWQEKLDSGMNL